MSDRINAATAKSASLAPGRYLAVLAATFVAGLALAWGWVWAAPLAFLDPEYPYWAAKQAMLSRCELGAVLVLGDSRPAVGIMPTRMPVPVANLAVGGGEAVEAQAALTRALACGTRPQRVILSFDPGHFARVDLFWERSVRFGFLGLAELRALRRTGERLGDPSFVAPRAPDGLPGPVRDVLYAVRFPPLYGASLVKGGIALRWAANRRALADGLASHGQYFFGTDAGSVAVASDAQLVDFAVLPVVDAYFEDILAMLSARGIPADFVAMPVNEATARAMPPRVMAGFAAYLAHAGARHANFHVVGPLLTAWPARYFGDEYGHLNPEGARLFSAWFAGCLAARMAGGDACQPIAPSTLLAERSPPGTTP
jgi:hypothetical protein